MSGRAASLALVALAISSFAIGTTEFVITGLLPEIAADFRVTIATAGLLVSGYALGVVVGAPLVTAAVARLPRKGVLLGLLVLFVAGNACPPSRRTTSSCSPAASWPPCATGPFSGSRPWWRPVSSRRSGRPARSPAC